MELTLLTITKIYTDEQPNRHSHEMAPKLFLKIYTERIPAQRTWKEQL